MRKKKLFEVKITYVLKLLHCWTKWVEHIFTRDRIRYALLVRILFTIVHVLFVHVCLIEIEILFGVDLMCENIF